jgi:osmoprotectant transport system substrate-binding protein
MVLTRRRLLELAAAAGAGAALGLTGCGSSKNITVASKGFQEQAILSSLLSMLIERDTKHSAATKDLSGTFLVHKSLTSGKIDCYVEYTGTAYTAILEKPPIGDVDEVYATVKREYADRWNLHWLPPLGFENTFAILVRKDDADKYGLVDVSDLALVAAEFRPGFGFEFYEREDGYKGLIGAYGLEFGKSPKQMILGQTYRALKSGDVDVIAGNSTDGLIDHLGLTQLRDDKGYFPPYYAAPVIRAATADKYPEAVIAIERLAGKISAAKMRAANYDMDHNQAHPKKAAQRLLEKLDV